MEPQTLAWAIPLFPLVGFLINAFAGARLTKSPRPAVDTSPIAATHDPVPEPEYDMDLAAAAAGPEADAHGPADAHGSDVHLDKGGLTLVGGLATALVILSFLVSLFLFQQIQSAPDHRILTAAVPWMQVPSAGSMPGLDLAFQLVVDPLNALMLLIITGVGALIHLYSMGYMSHDKGYARYFAYLNLFVFFMLVLVLAANFVVMFIGWEGVGLCSYLLIGFWYERKSANDAARKAFVVNRIGDAALLVALFLVYRVFGTFDYFGPGGVLTADGLAHAQATVGYGSASGLIPYAADLIPLLLFTGAAGKSAQIPLYVWLPDAMEGPTPVSALIHAATMVTAGVYLLSRTHALFLLSPVALTVVAVIGVSTAFLAATIALVQNDIKKVLAYSTVSQLGYMFLACGVGAFGTAMFHVTTHAFFKALLFLGAGSVIHAMGGEQDMRKMGGLRSKLPITFATMVIGALAIAGFPFLAGFFSKDAILMNAFAGPDQGGMGSPLLYYTGLFVSAMTAFYMMRLIMKTFFGAPRYGAEIASHVHESPMSMTLPLIVLAVLSVIGGYFKVPDYLSGVAGTPAMTGVPEMTLMIVSGVLAVAVLAVTFAVYNGSKTGELRTEEQKRRDPLWRALDARWWVDDVYNYLFVREGRRLAVFCWRILDRRVIDGAVNGAAGAVRGAAEGIKGWQNGYVRSYALSMLVGVALVVVGCLIGFEVVFR